MLAALDFDALRGFLVSWGAIAVVGGIVALLIRLRVPAARGRVFPPQRVRLAPWRLVDLFLVVFIYLAILALLDAALNIRPSRQPLQVLAMSLSGDAQAAASSGLAGSSLSALGPILDSAVAAQRLQADQALRQAWHESLSSPLAFAAIVAALVFIAGGRLYQLGLTGHHLAKVLIASYLVWLVVTPPTFLIFALVQQIDPPQKHPIEILAYISKDFSTWLLILFAVLVAAPCIEELLFRGIVQPIMVRAPEVADLTILATLIWTIIMGSYQAFTQRSLNSPWPIVILIGVGAGYLVFERLIWRWLPRPGAARAIFATSVLFAALHHTVWPTPIPLFFLSLGLGYLGYRTQSLIGPIVMHSLFNLVTVGELLQER